MRLLSILVICLALWTSPGLAMQPGPALAQELPALSSLTISLWPEYDDPSLLVIYRGQFATGATSPLPVEVRIPAEAGQPAALAYLDDTGQLLTLEHTTRAEGDRLVVAFELPTRDFQLEYYVPLSGSPAPGQRTFTYTYTADYAVATLNLKVQEPLSSRGLKLEPAAASVRQEADGLSYHLASAGPLKQTGTATWTISYEKTGSGLTIGAEPPAAIPPAAQGDGKQVPGVLIAVLALVALAAVGVGAYWLGRRAQPAPSPAASSKRRRGRPAVQDAGFCFKCGARLRAGADFCHQCGAAVRKS